MQDDFTFGASLKEVGSVIRLGSGLLGKSAIALGIWEAIILAAVMRLHSDGAILTGIVLGALGFFAWFIPIIRFADRHPDAALLEGAQWAQHQRDQMAAKNFTPSADDLRCISLPDSSPPSDQALLEQKPEEEG